MLLYLKNSFEVKVVVKFLYFIVTCKAGEEFFRLPNGEIADGASTERYMSEQLAIRNFYIWSRDSYALAWYFRFEVLEELMVRKNSLAVIQVTRIMA